MHHRRRSVTALILAALIAWPYSLPDAQAQAGGSCALGTLVPTGFEVVTVSSTAVGATVSKLTSATGRSISYIYGYVATDAIRVRDDGENPTASVGQPVAAGERFEVCGVKAARQFRMIRVTGDAPVSLSFYSGE
jgi:hypothetical protein